VDITLANLSILKQNKARAIRFSTLEALCRELECQPGDLIEYVPGAARADAAGGPEGESQRASSPPAEEP
jgi:putative transcriptional regulator